MAKSDLFDDLVWRGLAYQWTGEDALPARLRSGPTTLYHGCDPSADSLHIGNLIGLVALRRFQRAGHRPIALAGGGTGMIGDPSGRSEERNLLDGERLEANLAGIRSQLEQFLDFDAGEGSALLVNNADWLTRFTYVDFLRDVGKHFSVNVMLAKESVSARLESGSGITYTEFSYMLMQAYDFVHLHGEFGCELQIGGSDQFGNIVAGIDLGRRMTQARMFGLTWPLIERSDGAKMGKTAEGAIWLSPERTSPYTFYQWFVRVPDADVGPFLRLFTEVPRDEIEILERRAADAAAKREAQTRLARELTLMVHGEDGLAKAERATRAFFGGDLDGLEERDLLEIFADVPSVEVPKAALDMGIPAVDALVQAGLASSKSEARRVIEGGGAYRNNRRIESASATLGATDLATGTVMVLRAGKKSYALLRAV
ncbi:MAG TPA: tyrosine--tRNA ligase [Actinomycetota bacterium]